MVKVIGYDYYWNDTNDTHIAVTIWSDGRRTIIEEINKDDLIHTKELLRLPAGIRKLNSWRKTESG